MVQPDFNDGASFSLKILGWTWSGTKRNNTMKRDERQIPRSLATNHTIRYFSCFRKVGRDREFL